MATFFPLAALLLIFLIIFQIAKASEYVGVIRGEAKSRREQNKINGFFMIGFLVAGLIGAYLCNEALVGKTNLVRPAASDHGEKVDAMLKMTFIITGIVFLITQVLLFWFGFRYQDNDKRKAYFFPHNNKLEVIWTVVPAIAMTVLVVFGLRNWFTFTGEAPKNSMVVEVTGKQFGWIFRYPGRDGILGDKYYKLINDANANPLGQIYKDSVNKEQGIDVKADPADFDDVVALQTMYLVKNKPVKLVINSRDVIHDVGLTAFRLKMDAVPGTPTTMWFTPKYTTKEMKDITGDADFEYEISCDQMCGNGHYSMKGLITVVTQPEFDVWMAQQKPNYYAAYPDKDPAANKIPVSFDSSQVKPGNAVGAPGASSKSSALK